MYRAFIEANPDLQYVCKYTLYHKIFMYEFNIGFGYSRNDICNLCEKQEVDLKKAQIARNKKLQKKLKQEIKLHHQKAGVFIVQIQEADENVKLCNNCAVIAMDYQKNMPLPLTGVSQEYYKRQFWIHNVCIHDTVEDQETMFVYA